MKLVGREVLTVFAIRHADARGPIASWINEVEQAIWKTPQDIRDRYPSVSFLPGNELVFNIKGNAYRLIAIVALKTSIVVVKWIGTHAEYSKL